MPNRGTLNWNSSNTTYSVQPGYYSGGTLDSRTSYTNGYNSGYNKGKEEGSSSGGEMITIEVETTMELITGPYLHYTYISPKKDGSVKLPKDPFSICIIEESAHGVCSMTARLKDTFTILSLPDGTASGENIDIFYDDCAYRIQYDSLMHYGNRYDNFWFNMDKRCQKGQDVNSYNTIFKYDKNTHILSWTKGEYHPSFGRSNNYKYLLKIGC